MPRSALVSIGAQLILVPLIAFTIISSTTLPADVIIGIALIAAIPDGTTSNIFICFARGNPLLSITGLTTRACLVSPPYIVVTCP